MSVRTTIFFIVAALLAASLACGDKLGIAVGMPPDTEPSPGAKDTEKNEDSVTDKDSAGTPEDTGNGTGVGGDTETDTGTGALIEVPLSFPGGWISRDSNALAVQGSWYAYAAPLSSIVLTQPNDETVCVEGQVQPPPDLLDYETYFGAKAGFDLCADRPNDLAGKTLYSLEMCPWATNLPSRIVGIAFNISGTLPPELRLQFDEQNRSDGTYVLIEDASSFTAYLRDASLAYDTGAPPINVNEVTGVMLYVHSFQGPASFDYCIMNVRLLVRE